MSIRLFNKLPGVVLQQILQLLIAGVRDNYNCLIEK